jgi:hypothetical protein
MLPPFVTLNVTDPCLTVFVASWKPNSDGLPAVTDTVVACVAAPAPAGRINVNIGISAAHAVARADT